MTASASDNVGVVGVQFKLDGANLGAEVSVFPYSLSWDTTTAAAGGHSLTAVARDAAGNQTTSAAVAVTVNNGGGSSLVGQWSAPIEVGAVAVNMVMMHTGKVLMYSGAFTSSYTERVFDPVTGAITARAESVLRPLLLGSRAARGRTHSRRRRLRHRRRSGLRRRTSSTPSR